MNLQEEFWSVLKNFENTSHGPNAHVHAWNLCLSEQELAFFQIVQQFFDMAQKS